jgi:hypothetical protein
MAEKTILSYTEEITVLFDLTEEFCLGFISKGELYSIKPRNIRDSPDKVAPDVECYEVKTEDNWDGNSQDFIGETEIQCGDSIKLSQYKKGLLMRIEPGKLLVPKVVMVEKIGCFTGEEFMHFEHNGRMMRLEYGGNSFVEKFLNFCYKKVLANFFPGAFEVEDDMDEYGFFDCAAVCSGSEVFGFHHESCGMNLIKPEYKFVTTSALYEERKGLVTNGVVTCACADVLSPSWNDFNLEEDFPHGDGMIVAINKHNEILIPLCAIYSKTEKLIIPGFEIRQAKITSIEMDRIGMDKAEIFVEIFVENFKAAYFKLSSPSDANNESEDSPRISQKVLDKLIKLNNTRSSTDDFLPVIYSGGFVRGEKCWRFHEDIPEESVYIQENDGKENYFVYRKSIFGLAQCSIDPPKFTITDENLEKIATMLDRHSWDLFETLIEFFQGGCIESFEEEFGEKIMELTEKDD